MANTAVLQYSSCNEDSASELSALDLAGKRAVSILAAGGRAYSLLLGDPREVVAVDRNPAQVHLAHLTRTAMLAFDRETYLGFVGIRSMSNRLERYRALREALPFDARVFWDDRTGDIAHGIQHVGVTERGIARVAPFFRMCLGTRVAKLRAARTLEEQAQIARETLDGPLLRAVLGAVFNPISGKWILRDQVYYGDVRRDAAAYLRERLLETFRHHRFDDCFVLQLFWDGELRGDSSLPVHLTEENYETVRSRLDLIRFERSCVIDYLSAQPAESFDAFSLSDLGGYLDAPAFAKLLREVERVATPRARVCIREYISEPTKRAPCPARLVRDAALEQQLAIRDRSVGCTFVCATRAEA